MFITLGEIQAATATPADVANSEKLTPEREAEIRAELEQIRKEGFEAARITGALEQVFRSGLEIKNLAEGLRQRRESLEFLKAEAVALSNQGMGELLLLEQDTGVLEDPFLHGFMNKARKGIQKGLDKVRQTAVGSVKTMFGKRFAAEVDRNISRAGGLARGDPETYKKVYGKAGGAMFLSIRAMIMTVVTFETTQLTVRLLLAKREDRKKLRLKLKGAAKRAVSLLLMVAAIASSIVTGPVGIVLALSIATLNAGVEVAFAIDAANQTKEAAKKAKKIALAEFAKIEADDRKIRDEISRLKASIEEVRRRRHAAAHGLRAPEAGATANQATARRESVQTTLVLGGVGLIGAGLVAWHYLGSSDRT